MTVDHSLTCQGAYAKSARALAGFIIVIFPIGVPFALLVQLYTNRRQIMQRDTRSGDKELGYIGMLGRE